MSGPINGYQNDGHAHKGASEQGKVSDAKMGMGMGREEGAHMLTTTS